MYNINWYIGSYPYRFIENFRINVTETGNKFSINSRSIDINRLFYIPSVNPYMLCRPFCSHCLQALSTFINYVKIIMFHLIA